MDDSTLASAFERLDAAHQLSGTVLVAQDRDVVLERAYGLASHQLDVPNTLDTKFAIASVTKMFTAMAALVLAEQGRIGLGERPAAYVPELARLDRGITLHHLLSHTAGLRDVYDVPELGYEVCNLRHDGGNLLEYLAAQPRLFPPGEGWSYSSTGYLLLGYVLERAEGAAFDEVLTRHVLAPLAALPATTSRTGVWLTPATTN